MVLIRGDGVAARCCGHLLSQSGVPVYFERVDRPRIPVILLSETAQSLIRDVFGRGDLFLDLPRIGRRAVAWGTAANPMELSHSAVVLSEEALLERLGSPIPVQGVAEIDWTICTSRPLPSPVTEHRFGSRKASTRIVELAAGTDPSSCWIESLENGWLFLIANGPGSGWLVSVGSGSEEMLGESRLIQEQISATQPASGQFVSSPRIVDPLADLGWIACGTAAMAFDPICGDGTAHAVREAILAAAVIRAAARGEDQVSLLEHYQTRLLAGFQRHLVECLPYYTSGGQGEWWESEANSVRQGVAWCVQRLGPRPSFRYRLDGFELCAV
ncbi:MAG TPA: hypothetical protein VKU19_38715 [Bryobacteraceae bacterium]|nr:hypothetical protein [Bryobacteraceae bacterium]